MYNKQVGLVFCPDELFKKIRLWLDELEHEVILLHASSFLEIKDKVVFDDVVFVMSQLSADDNHGIDFLRSVMAAAPLAQRIALLEENDFELLTRAVNKAHIDYLAATPCEKKQMKTLVHKAQRRHEHISRPFKKFEVLTEVTEDLLQQNEKFRKEATSDPLTKLLNRRSFDSFCGRFWERWQHSQVTFCLALIDLDHFKNINDSFGHVAGDQVLREVARLLRSNQRSGIDFAFRYGGEEFAILSITTEPDEMHNYIKRLVHTLRNKVIQLEDGQKVKVTMSAGISTIYTCASIEELIQKADESLYEAKEKGRDRAILNYDLF